MGKKPTAASGLDTLIQLINRSCAVGKEKNQWSFMSVIVTKKNKRGHVASSFLLFIDKKHKNPVGTVVFFCCKEPKGD